MLRSLVPALAFAGVVAGGATYLVTDRQDFGTAPGAPIAKAVA
jgi:hypothetical protein